MAHIAVPISLEDHMVAEQLDEAACQAEDISLSCQAVLVLCVKGSQGFRAAPERIAAQVLMTCRGTLQCVPQLPRGIKEIQQQQHSAFLHSQLLMPNAQGLTSPDIGKYLRKEQETTERSAFFASADLTCP